MKYEDIIKQYKEEFGRTTTYYNKTEKEICEWANELYLEGFTDGIAEAESVHKEWSKQMIIRIFFKDVGNQDNEKVYVDVIDYSINESFLQLIRQQNIKTIIPLCNLHTLNIEE